jgi:alpha-L-fucosidase
MSTRRTVLKGAAAIAAASFAPAAAKPPRWQPTAESLNARLLPAWFDAAKFGIFVHWGLYSVPAFAPFGPNPDPRAPDMMARSP